MRMEKLPTPTPTKGCCRIMTMEAAPYAFRFHISFRNAETDSTVGLGSDSRRRSTGPIAGKRTDAPSARRTTMAPTTAMSRVAETVDEWRALRLALHARNARMMTPAANAVREPEAH